MKLRCELLLACGLFLALVLIFWSEALPEDRTLFLRDLSAEIIPVRSFWVRSGGFALWNPYSFFGMPYSANPQNQAFYPFNLFYYFFGAERGLVFYIIFHHFLFVFTLYWALREMGFQREGSFLGAIGFSFGGFVCSLSMLVAVLSTLIWFPLIIIFLIRAGKSHWLKPGLGIGLLIALQVFAGEMEIAGISWLLSLFAILFLPEDNRGHLSVRRIFLALGLGIFFGAILSAFQWLITLEFIPLSNRASGFGLVDALLWSIEPFQLKSFVIPNYILPASRLSLSTSAFWGLGFFSEYSYFLSLYSGIIVLLLALFSMGGVRSWKIWFWVLLAGFALAMSMGNTLPVYKFFYFHIPFFNLFRFPSKFLFLFYFALMMLAVYGWQRIQHKPRRIFGFGVLIIGIGVLLYLIFSRLNLEDSSLGAELIAHKFFLRSSLRVLAFFCLGLGLIFLLGSNMRFWLSVGLGVLCFLDLFFAHRYLNPVIKRDFYRGNSYVQEFNNQNRSLVYPPRIASLSAPSEELSFQWLTDPIELYSRLRDGLENYWSTYFGIADLRAYSLFCLSEVSELNKLLAEDSLSPGVRRLALARSGVEYIYYRDYGFVNLSLSYPRALILYQAKIMKDREQIFRIFSDANFPGLRSVLIEAEDKVAGDKNFAPMSDFARVISYENEKVVIDAEARADGWLLLLDSYYPGWRAFVDGKEVRIYRANGFFRAVKIPAGRHRVIFNYFPESFTRGLLISGIGFFLWLFLFGISFKMGKGRK